MPGLIPWIENQAWAPRRRRPGWLAYSGFRPQSTAIEPGKEDSSMKILVFSLTLLAALSSFAVTSQPVSYKSGDETVQAVLYTPEGQGPFPALVVIHEYWGLNDWVKEQASKLAGEGYAALAIDLYRGKVGTTPDEAHELMRGVSEDRAARDLHAAVAFLEVQPNVKKARIGAIGWCLGGGYAFKLALQEPSLAADVINYGDLAADPERLRKIRAPILGIFGGQDRYIPVDDLKKSEQALKQQGHKVEIVIYPEAGHAFENPNNTAGYRAADAADAWKRTVGFLTGTLKK
jgi:carboxymethylenebutenolidase